MACAGSPVMSSPAKRTLPTVGFTTPVMRWNSVVLPAPLGPMTARISPLDDLHVDVVDGDEGAVALRQAVEVDQGSADARSTALSACLVPASAMQAALRLAAASPRLNHPVARPQMPSGANRTKPMKTRPKNSAQASV